MIEDAESAASLATTCARHPSVETLLRCGRCETPICPRCLVTTPVGARCPDCAKVRRNVRLASRAELSRAALYGVGAATGVTLVVAYVGSLVPFIGLLGTALAGYATGEAVLRGVNLRQGTGASPLAAAAFVLGYLLATTVFLALVGPLRGLPVEAVIAAIPRVAQSIAGAPLAMVGIFVGAWLAWMRAR